LTTKEHKGVKNLRGHKKNQVKYASLLNQLATSIGKNGEIISEIFGETLDKETLNKEFTEEQKNKIDDIRYSTVDDSMIILHHLNQVKQTW